MYSTLAYYNSTIPQRSGYIMKSKRKIGFFLEAVAVLILMAVLSSIAAPQIGEMFENDQNDLRDNELTVIQKAVTEMLADSSVKTLMPVGPTQEMAQVRTNDIPPLTLADYLYIQDGFTIETDCSYSFTVNGDVNQHCS